MKRVEFISIMAAAVPGILIQQKNMLMENQEPLLFHFKDDGQIPNSKYSLIVYKNAFPERGIQGAERLEKKFSSNNWTNSWRWGVYPFHHYHSNTHEVLGVFSGNALLQLGGERGEKVKVEPGDIIIIPAGVGHKNLGSSNDFTVVGAYPNGKEPDLNKGWLANVLKQTGTLQQFQFLKTILCWVKIMD